MLSPSAHFVYAFDPRSQQWDVRFDDYEPCKDDQWGQRYAESPEEALRKIEEMIQLRQRKTMDDLAWQREELCRIAEQMRAVCTNPQYMLACEARAYAEYVWRNPPDEERRGVPWERTITCQNGRITVTGKG